MVHQKQFLTNIDQNINPSSKRNLDCWKSYRSFLVAFCSVAVLTMSTPAKTPNPKLQNYPSRRIQSKFQFWRLVSIILAMSVALIRFHYCAQFLLQLPRFHGHLNEILRINPSFNYYIGSRSDLGFSFGVKNVQALRQYSLELDFLKSVINAAANYARRQVQITIDDEEERNVFKSIAALLIQTWIVDVKAQQAAIGVHEEQRNTIRK